MSTLNVKSCRAAATRASRLLSNVLLIVAVILLALCGDGHVEGAEQCDDGPANSDAAPDACRTNCRLAHRGDGVIDTGETCDDGPQNSDEVPDACRNDCTAPRCGDGVVDVESGETCDDSNTRSGDGCSDHCVSEFCGNGQLDAGEVCDDGNIQAGDGCSPDCQSDESCGNGITDYAADELCDCGTDPNHLPPGCPAINGAPLSVCTDTCETKFCGDGILSPGKSVTTAT